MAIEKSKVSVKIGDIYKLSIGLNKYSDYPNKEIGSMVYKNIHAINDYVVKVDSLMQPVKEYYEGLENINRKYGVTKESGYKCSDEYIDAYRGEIDRYIKEKDFGKREAEIRKEQVEMFSMEVEIELYVGMIEDMPKEFSAQDFDHFRIIIKDL